MAEQQSPARVRIEAQPGHASIVVNGTELGPDVVAYTLQHDVQSSFPELVLHARNTEGAQWEGMARVAIGVPQNPADLICEFLAAVDPEELDRAALNRADYGGGKGATARAMLTQLTEWARGAGHGGD